MTDLFSPVKLEIRKRERWDEMMLGVNPVCKVAKNTNGIKRGRSDDVDDIDFIMEEENRPQQMLRVHSSDLLSSPPPSESRNKRKFHIAEEEIGLTPPSSSTRKLTSHEAEVAALRLLVCRKDEENKILKRAVGIQDARLREAAEVNQKNSEFHQHANQAVLENAHLRDLLNQAASYVEKLSQENHELKRKLVGDDYSCNFIVPQPPPDVF